MTEKDWLNDTYVKTWLTGLKARTAQNYKERFPHWLEFIDMTPEQQIKKRMHDVISEDITERQFFELKFREYKAYLETKEIKGSTVTTELTSVSSFFTRNGLPLNLRRGDWKANVTQEPTKKWKLALDDVKRMYGHANLRDKALLLVLAQNGFSEVDTSEFRIKHFPKLWDMPMTEHYYIEKCREKTGFEQATCLSYEALHDIREMLMERGNPKEGFLFVSQTKGKGEQISTRTINEAMKALAERTFGEEKAKEERKLKLLESNAEAYDKQTQISVDKAQAEAYEKLAELRKEESRLTRQLKDKFEEHYDGTHWFNQAQLTQIEAKLKDVQAQIAKIGSQTVKNDRLSTTKND